MYNARAVSTLSNESFFSDFVCFDKESHGYPKGVNVCKVFSRVVLINYFKHKHDPNYFLSATVKAKYEVKLAENNICRTEEKQHLTIKASTGITSLTLQMSCSHTVSDAMTLQQVWCH